MTSGRSRWLRLSQLFDHAIDLDPAQRDALLEAECADDLSLRAELLRMLEADAADSAFDAGARGIISHPTQDAGEHDGADDAPAHRLGRWRVDRELGRGAMGTVHAAHRDDDTAQRAAIKRLRRRWDGSTQAQRFLQERRILAVLSHPNIPRLLDNGIDGDGRPWFALEYVDGSPLDAWADARRLPLRERVALFAQVCEAVQHAHEHFVVHRDLKPANILVDNDGRAKVLDFGVAKRMDEDAGSTRTGMFAGFTPEYAAPEQISGGAISAATDVHALGVVLYRLLAGRLPFTFPADDLRAAAEAISTQQPPRLEQAITTGSDDEVATRLRERRTDTRAFRRFVRGDLGRILQTALAKEPQRRYASVRAFADDLQRFLDGRPVSVTGDTIGYRTRKFVQRNRGIASLAAITAIVVVLGIASVLHQSARVRQHAAEAERQAEQALRVRDFALQLLADANPTNAAFGGDLERVFSHAATDLVERFSGQPDLLAQIADLLASTMSDSGERASAERLLRDVRKTLAADPGAAPWARKLIDVRLSQETLAAGQAVETDALLDGAIDTLSPDRAEHIPILTDAWQVRAYQRLSQGREQEALESARTASRLAHAHMPADSRVTAHADLSRLILLATTSVTAPPQALAEGTPMFESVRGFYGDTHPVTRNALKYMAMLQQENGMVREAEATYRQLLAAAAATGDQRRLAFAGLELASLLEEDDRFREAEVAYDEAIRHGTEHNAPDRQFMLAARNNRAFNWYRAGDWRRAAEGFDEVASAWHRIHADADHAYVLSARTRQADALVESGQLAQAGQRLDDLLPRLAAHDADFHPLGLSVRAKLHLARQDPAAARRDIDAAFAAASQGDLTPRSEAALWTVRARVLLAQGESGDASTAISEAAARLQDADPWRNPERARLALLQLRAGPAAGATTLCDALRDATGSQSADEDAPFQADVRQAVGRCPG
ncbi:serine/threonine-protein kinase [Luteimonas kalidii]|uniref:Protein kinase n=1 Tax=Luteimonas kalidii TaxID=3042025 RepID=A0ABT6JWW3_9GAMM|nr:serine/threonine-protein kinase [Luteimonas kalidii]MDH5835180.1 protein kinase [Luteimonas kalidii]